MKREIKKGPLLIIALFSVLIGIAVTQKVDALKNYTIYACIVIFAVVTSVYAFILKALDAKKPLSEAEEKKEQPTKKKGSSYSLFPSAEEIEAASKVEMASEDTDADEEKK